MNEIVGDLEISWRGVPPCHSVVRTSLFGRVVRAEQTSVIPAEVI